MEDRAGVFRLDRRLWRISSVLCLRKATRFAIGVAAAGRVVGVTTVYVYDVVWDENMFPRKGTCDEQDLSADTPIRASAATSLSGSPRKQS